MQDGGVDTDAYLGVLAFQNVSCVLMALWSPTELSNLGLYNGFLCSEGRLLDALDQGGSLPASAVGLQALSLASCNGSSCNALNRQWVLASNLSASERYHYVAWPYNYLSSGSLGRQVLGYMAQAFSSPGAECRDRYCGKVRSHIALVHQHGVLIARFCSCAWCGKWHGNSPAASNCSTDLCADVHADECASVAALHEASMVAPPAQAASGAPAAHYQTASAHRQPNAGIVHGARSHPQAWQDACIKSRLSGC